jgi:ABC-type maltose transport system permease subunit
MDHASEWRIFWRIMLPLSSPALAVVAIFSILSRWNDFLLPLIVLNRREVYTLQLALNSFQSEFEIRYDLLLAMTADGAAARRRLHLPAALHYHRYRIHGHQVSFIHGQSRA